MAKKPLRIGMVGYGFMGRAHSNGWRQVERFFPELDHVPVLQMACARDQAKRTYDASGRRSPSGDTSGIS